MDKETRKETDRNVVYIGTKPFMNYVTAVVMQFTTQNQKEVKIVARGKFISRAVDVAELAKNNFLGKENNVVYKDIKLGSEKFNRKEDNKEIKVSTIEITIGKV